MASSGGTILSTTIRDITNTKLEELSKRRSSFETHKERIISSLGGEEQPLKRLQLLSKGVKACYGVKTDNADKVVVGHTKNPDLELELSNLDCFLGQAAYDPSVSSKMMNTWEKSLFRHLDMQSLKFQYASLYAQLVTEWLETEKSETKDNTSTTIEDMAMSEGFVDIASELKQKSRLEWERNVFEPAVVDEPALQAYLTDVFGLEDTERPERKEALKRLQEKVVAFENELSKPNKFNTENLQWVGDGLMASGLLSDEKRDALKEFKNNKAILSEIADVLNMRLSALDTWSWGTEGVLLERQRKVSGVYNYLMHEDILQALFLQYIGVRWSVFLKNALREFIDAAGGWIPMRKDVPREDAQRRSFFMGPESDATCLQSFRQDKYKDLCFLSHLKDSENQRNEDSDGDDEAQSFQSRSALARPILLRANGPAPYMGGGERFSQRCNGKAPMSHFDRGINEWEDGYIDKGKKSVSRRRPMMAKQHLLHLLSTEVAVNTKLYGELTAFRAVFEDWDSLLPHETILSVFEHVFGVSEVWRNFFGRFLSAPLKFVEDGPEAPCRTRRRGTPTSHVLSAVFGEATLFCLDVAVNRSTDGNVLWRMHDDLWFWSRHPDVTVEAWEAVERFAAITGTRIDNDKSGSVRVSVPSTSRDTSDPTSPSSASPNIYRPSSLPSGDIRWGFLRLSPYTGRFEIDGDMVDRHIIDLRRQLSRCRSVFAFVQTWNTYVATFLTSNFGKPANCFGRAHVREILATHNRIQRAIFSSSTSSSLAEAEVEASDNVVDHLKKTLQRRFGVSDVPDAFLFFPVELGGLGLENAFVSILQVHDTVLEDPGVVLDRFVTVERESYLVRKAAFEAQGPFDTINNITPRHPNSKNENFRQTWGPGEYFMSFEEYVRYREDFDVAPTVRVADSRCADRLRAVYEELLREPVQRGIGGNELPGIIASGVQALKIQRRNVEGGIMGNWPGMRSYWQWIAVLYGPEAMERFGGLGIVEPGLLPMGMVSLFKDRKVKWRD